MYVVILGLSYALKGYSVCTETHLTIDLVWGTYDLLFTHLEVERAAMLSSANQWGRNLVPALDAAKNKLSTYYKKTHDKYAYFYNFGTILNPMSELEICNSSAWGPKYARKFRADFIRRFNYLYAADYTSSQQNPGALDPLLRSAPLVYMPLPSSARLAAHISQAEQYLGVGRCCFLLYVMFLTDT